MAIPSTPLKTTAASAPVVNPRAALAVVTTIFFMWGFLTCLNDILIPHLKSVFQLNFAQAMLVQFTFFGAYFLMSLPAGWLVAHVGYKKGIVIGLMVAGIGALGFWPAAELRIYGAFLTTLFVLATGITVLQVAANPYVALLGPERTSSSRLTLAQALNSLGTTLAPYFGGVLILSSTVRSSEQIAAMPELERAAYFVSEAQAVQGPYLGLGIFLFVLALFVFLFRLPALIETTEQSDTRAHRWADVLRHPHLVFGVLGIFFYVGAEVTIGSLMVNYFSLPEIGGITEAQASRYLMAYWFLAMVGRFAGSAMMVILSPRKSLAAFAAVNIALLATTMSSTGMLAVYSLIAIGLFNSIMFPTIFALSIERLGPLTSKASSLLIMAIVGGAVVPFLQGLLADRIGLQHSFILPLLCYGYIIFYGLVGARPGTASGRGG
ncbi:sugar MFS transporter [Stenotrophomonas nitritireducens]|uniref:sugar MFS transporter n=1 Tax=Stenotrophomonas nitritireducens TaxID=83617 RepID=UPI003D9994E3